MFLRKMEKTDKRFRNFFDDIQIQELINQIDYYNKLLLDLKGRLEELVFKRRNGGAIQD